MNQEEAFLPGKPEPRDEIRLVLLPRADIRENLLVQKRQRIGLDVGRHLREEQIEELQEERREELLEEPVVVYQGLGFSLIDDAGTTVGSSSMPPAALEGRW